METLAHLDLGKFMLFTLVLTRVSGLVVTAPIYGSRDVPPQVRALLAASLTLLVLPSQWNVAVNMPGSIVQYLVFLGSELLVGLCLGLGIVILFSGAQLAGELIGHTSGMMLSDIYDPTMDAQVPVMGQLMYLVAMAVFVSIGGHRLVMAGLLDTFQTMPPGTTMTHFLDAMQMQPNAPGFLGAIVEPFVNLLGESFRLGIRASVPVIAALLLATFVLGLVSRTLPQLNVMMLGFGLNAMLTLSVLSLTLGAAAWVFQAEIEPTLETLLGIFRPTG